MGYGLLDIANQSRREALQGISDADRRREEIEAANKQMAAPQKVQLWALLLVVSPVPLLVQSSVVLLVRCFKEW